MNAPPNTSAQSSVGIAAFPNSRAVNGIEAVATWIMIPITTAACRRRFESGIVRVCREG